MNDDFIITVLSNTIKTTYTKYLSKQLKRLIMCVLASKYIENNSSS